MTDALLVLIAVLITMSAIYLGKQLDSLRVALRDQDATLERIHKELEGLYGVTARVSDNTFQVTPEGRRRADEAMRTP